MITLAEAKQYLGITDTADDALLNALISGATAYVRTQTKRNLSVKEYTEDFPADDEQIFQLADYPINTVTSVKTIIGGTEVTLTEDEDYFVFKDEGYIELSYEVEGRGAKLRVVHNSGFTAVPEDIKMAIKLLVKQAYAERGTDKILQSETVGDWSQSYKVDAVPVEITSILTAYEYATI